MDLKYVKTIIRANAIQIVLFSWLFCCCQAWAQSSSPPSDLASFVNPLIGTDRGGDTFPGAVAPFGMMQLSPNWKDNGYYYTNRHMHGFVLNLMSGDGGGNEGQVLVTATTGAVKIDRPDTDFAFDHKHESAAAGYYQVLMRPWNINAQLTTTTRCGMMKLTFPPGKQANILLPLSYANNPVFAAHVHLADDHTVTGAVTSEAFSSTGRSITVYFVMVFSQPFATHGVWTGTTMAEGQGDAAQVRRGAPVIGLYGSYPATSGPREVEVRIGMSYVDVNGAWANLKAEMPGGTSGTGGTFAQYRESARQAWNRELSLIETEGGTRTHNRIFYTALYHAMLAPTIYEDVDGRYRGFDNQIHSVSPGHDHFYATFSGWDIYRSEIPLLALIEPRRAQDMAQSIVAMAEQLHYIDRWPQLNQPTGTMNGSPLTICLAHLWNAGLHDFDMTTAYEAMFRQAQPGNLRSHLGEWQGLAEEQRIGVTINADASVSTALEYDLSFAALGHLAQSLGKPEDANFLLGRALQYREMFNPQTGFLQRRLIDGTWDDSFGGYTEGNQWIYLWFVPQDVDGLVALLGGPETFAKRLDQFFHDKHYDPTNEPDLQAPFLYDYVSRPWKTQQIVADIADQMFTDSPGGLAGGGNDDLGTMSAWYIFTQLGFYPVDPGIPAFEVCTPRFPRVTIHLSPPHLGKQFVIDAPGAGGDNRFIQSSSLNGAPLTTPWFPESALTGGGLWKVVVGPQPNEKWAASPYDRPYSLSTGWNHVPAQPLVPTGRSNPVTWHYTTSQPPRDWYRPDFNDAAWPQGRAGFGTNDEGVTPRTHWSTDDIWMRRSFTLPAAFTAPAILAYHDQGIKVYINGVEAARDDKWVNQYSALAITSQASATLHPGINTLAVHVHHAGEGRHFADVGLIHFPR